MVATSPALHYDNIRVRYCSRASTILFYVFSPVSVLSKRAWKGRLRGPGVDVCFTFFDASCGPQRPSAAFFITPWGCSWDENSIFKLGLYSQAQRREANAKKASRYLLYNSIPERGPDLKTDVSWNSFPLVKPDRKRKPSNISQTAPSTY
ncbi:hypothetical protein VTN00DRAFT_4606 [Thermoascus crustaceus]|uniref:uncharacterized protein n=1 Tax=Thermoascus crustaceus TaxID=5088 RepID=UPI003742F0E6